MPITPIQVPGPRSEQRDKEESTADKILKGLQIANQVFQIPVSYASFTKNMAEKGVEEQKLGVATRQAGGTFTEGELAARNEQAFPIKAQDQESMLLPGDDKETLLPPSEAEAPKQFASRRGSILLPSGEKQEAYIALKSDIEKSRADIDALTKDVSQVSETYNQADINYKNILQAAPRAAASSESSEKLLVNAAKLWNPNVRSIADIGKDQSLPEYIQSSFAWFTGKGSQKLTGEQIQEIVDQSHQSIQGYKQALDENLSVFADRAVERGYTPKQIGIRDREIAEPVKLRKAKSGVSKSSSNKNLEKEFLELYGGK